MALPLANEYLKTFDLNQFFSATANISRESNNFIERIYQYLDDTQISFELHPFVKYLFEKFGGLYMKIYQFFFELISILNKDIQGGKPDFQHITRILKEAKLFLEVVKKFIEKGSYVSQSIEDEYNIYKMVVLGKSVLDILYVAMEIVFIFKNIN